MKCISYFVVTILILNAVLTSCKDSVLIPNKFTVIFDTNGGSDVQTQIVKEGEKVIKPEIPVKASHTFVAWYKEVDLMKEWNFTDDVVITDITLYAKWLEDKEVELFFPQSNMTQTQIIDLLEEAINNTISSAEISYTFRDTTNRYNDTYDLTAESTTDYLFSFNKQTQKLLEVYTYHGWGEQFCFIDGYDSYNCLQAENLYKHLLPDVYWSHFDNFRKIDFEINCNRYTWTIKEKYFIGKNEGVLPIITGFSHFNEELEITLTKDLKINDFYSHLQVGASYDKRKCSVSYIVNPLMPENYTYSDFTSTRQYKVKIIWENGEENIFYTSNNGDGLGWSVFSSSDVVLYFSSNKELQLFMDEKYTYPVALPIILTENATFYAKWVDF